MGDADGSVYMVMQEREGKGGHREELECYTNIPSSNLSPHSMTLELAALLNIAIHN